MSYSRLKLAAFCVGALTVWLAAAAETPGVERIGCCASPWAYAPPAAATHASRGGFIQRGRKTGAWSIHVAGVGSPPFTLPKSVDQAVRRALGDAEPRGDGGGDDYALDETDHWSFQGVLYGGGAGAWAGEWRKRCHKHDDELCRKHHPPPPPTPGVPEPSEWALLVTGVAAVGAALRRSAAARPQSV